MKKNTQSLRQSRRKFMGTSLLTGTAAVTALSLPFSQQALASGEQFASLKSLKPSPELSGVTLTLPPLAAMVLNKAGFGPRPGDIDAFNALGVDDSSRLTTWVNDQLNPTVADPEVDARMNAMMLANASIYDTINKTPAQLWTEHARFQGTNAYLTRNRPRWQMERLMMLRGLYGKWQLREMLNDFWFNHFNVKGNRFPAQSMLPHYNEEIRSRMFGNFYDLLLADAKTASMLFYLDNYRNSWPYPNENWARELLELHTLGAIENYYGAIDPNTVGTNIKGQRAGYTEIDVFQFARALTGWSIADGTGGSNDTGAFLFRANDHYNEHAIESIKVLDINLTVNQGENDVTDILQYLANHYGTARFIAWKLCTRFVGDNPPESLVSSTADVFYNNSTATDQLKLVYRHILLSNEFKNTWGAKVKRPLENIISAMRAAAVNIDFRDDHRPSNGVFNRLTQTGQRPFNNDAPTGFPDEKALWSGSGPLVSSWRTITYFLNLSGATYTNPDTGINEGLWYCNLAEQANTVITDSTLRTPTNLVDMWMMRLRGYSYDATTKNRLITYVMDKSGLTATQAFNSIDSNNTSNSGIYQRVNYTLVGLILMSPDAIRR